MKPTLFRTISRTMSSAISNQRASDLRAALSDINSRIQEASGPAHQVALIAVSKYKPASDVLACYEAGQRDFGENYVQELIDKANELPADIQWHFIGTLQSNKAKALASIPNLNTVQTVSSTKAATALDKHWPTDRAFRLNVLLQVNTSGEDAKSGLPPPSSSASPEGELFDLAQHILKSCPRLYLQGLMTIGSLSESLSSTGENHDFETLKRSRDALQTALSTAKLEGWGKDGKLLLSMGMSSDFESALRAGSDIVRVGTGIFSERPKKGE